MIDLPSPALIGVIHLPALPGSPANLLPVDAIVHRALIDGHTLQDAGFDALIIENFGDRPFPPRALPPASLAGLAVVADQVRRATSMPIGINALRNDAYGAMGIAASAGATFIRVNLHVGVAASDQGQLEGRADLTLGYRKLLGQRIAILADVHVKHATPISELDIARAAQDTAYRGRADGLIVTGPATGSPADRDQLRRVCEAVPDRRIFVGSGVTAETVTSYLNLATGVIVGTGLKVDRNPDNPIDPCLAQEFAQAAGRK